MLQYNSTQHCTLHCIVLALHISLHNAIAIFGLLRQSYKMKEILGHHSHYHHLGLVKFPTFAPTVMDTLVATHLSNLSWEASTGFAKSILSVMLERSLSTLSDEKFWLQEWRQSFWDVYFSKVYMLLLREKVCTKYAPQWKGANDEFLRLLIKLPKY